MVKKQAFRLGCGVLALIGSSAALPAEVQVVASATTVNVGETFYLDVFGTNFPETFGPTLILNFNSSVVAVGTPTLGTGIVLGMNSPFTGGVAVPPDCDSAQGSPFTSGCNFSVLAPTVGALPSGDFGGESVVRFTFTALASGAANIELFDDQADFVWADTSFLPIPVNYTQAVVTVAGGVTDTTPDAFAFTDVTNQALSAQVISNAITVTGINAVTPISVTGGEYSINGSAFTALAGTVVVGNLVRARVTTAGSASTAADVTVTIGGVADTFTATTAAVDTTPNPFSFTDVINQPLSAQVISAQITVAGINSPAPISVTGGEYSINGAAFTSAAGTVLTGNTVRARVTTSAAPATAAGVTVTIGGVADTFTATTVAGDTTPDAFFFSDATNQPRSTEVISSQVTVAGINVAAPISVTGGEYSVNGGAFTAAAGTVVAGDLVRVRLTTSANASTATTAIVTIGGVAGTFTATTSGGSSGSSSLDSLSLLALGLLAWRRRTARCNCNSRANLLT